MRILIGVLMLLWAGRVEAQPAEPSTEPPPSDGGSDPPAGIIDAQSNQPPRVVTPVAVVDPRIAQLRSMVRTAASQRNCATALNTFQLLVDFDPASRILAGEKDFEACIEYVQPKVKTVSYRRQVVISDLLSIATLPVGVGILGALFGAPLVHLSNGNSGSAAASFGLRLIPICVFIGTGECQDSCRVCG